VDRLREVQREVSPPVEKGEDLIHLVSACA
jgi:hypothetical protein